jgi:hypothetical protein
MFMLLVLFIGQYGGAQQEEVDEPQMKEELLPELWKRLAFQSSIFKVYSSFQGC